MKTFFSSCLGTIFGLFLFGALVVAICIGLIAAATASGSKSRTKEVTVQKGSYLVVNLSANITDAPPPSDFKRFLNKLTGDTETNSYSVRQIASTLRSAATDNRIDGVFLVGSLQPQGYGAGFAALKELREALTEFKGSGKKIAAYLTMPSKRDYYLTSVADPIYLNPYSEMDFTGLVSEPTFYGDMLKKYGIGVQVTRVGKYKSAVEPFTRNSLSEEAREQTAKLLGDMWDEWRTGIEQARKIPAAKIQELADTKPIVSAEDAVKLGFVTKLAYLPEVLAELRGLTGSDSENTNTFRQVKLEDYHSSFVATKEGDGAPKVGEKDSRNRIAVIYAEGDIIDGNSMNDATVAGDRYARQLRKLRQDANVKAIVLRVNSPGGSAFASEVILKELQLAREAGKPVIVSFGTVAASGGYYIACASDRIFAQPNTITGSIGVFGILPNMKDFAGSWGVTFDTVKTGKFGNIFSIKGPKSPEELAAVQTFVDRIYDTFVNHVARARKLSPERVKEIAQGRVWSGTEALKLGLVDEVGGLERAIAYARELAKLPADAPLSEWPIEKDFAQQLAESISGKRNPFASWFGGTSTADRAAQELAVPFDLLRIHNDPLGAYTRLPFALDVR